MTWHSNKCPSSLALSLYPLFLSLCSSLSLSFSCSMLLEFLSQSAVNGTTLSRCIDRSLGMFLDIFGFLPPIPNRHIKSKQLPSLSKYLCNDSLLSACAETILAKPSFSNRNTAITTHLHKPPDREEDTGIVQARSHLIKIMQWHYFSHHTSQLCDFSMT